MCISGRSFLVCAALCSLNSAWAISNQIWPPTQVLCKKSSMDEFDRLVKHKIIVPNMPQFDNFLTEATLWVDKSLLIETLFEYHDEVHTDVIIVTSNPRWGKSMNLNMFAFYCELYTDAEGLPLDREQSPAYQYFVNGVVVNGKHKVKTHPQPPLISSYKGNEEHLANYPVIRLHGGVLNMRTGISSLRKLIFETYSRHTPLRNRLLHLSTYGSPASKSEAKNNLEIFNTFYTWNSIMGNMPEDTLLSGIRLLCNILKSTYNREVVIVYDEHDNYLQEAYFGNTRFQSTNETSYFHNCLNEFMLKTFKDNPHLKKALITGVLSVHEATFLSNLNYVEKSYVFDYNNLFPFYGIFEWEFQKLMELRGFDTVTFDVPPSLKYDGFRSLSNLSSPMFSTHSVANFISATKPSVISHLQTGSIVNCMAKMLNQPTFEAEMLDFVRSLDDTFATIPYFTFKSLTAKDCDLVNAMKHGAVTYDPLQHRNVMFSHLLYAGLVTVAENQKSNPGGVDIKIPNEEVMSFIKNKIITMHGVNVRCMEPAKSALMEYMRGVDDRKTFPKLIDQLGSYLSTITRGQGFGTTNRPHDNHQDQILSNPHYPNEHSVHTVIFCLLLNTFSKIIPLKLLNQKTLSKVRFANEPVTVQRHGFNKHLDTYIDHDNVALIIEYKQADTGDSIESALKQALSYGFMYQAYNIQYPVLKFMALRVSPSLYIESQCVTIPTAKFNLIFTRWNETTFNTNDYTFKNWETYVYDSLSDMDAVVVKYEYNAI